VSKLTQNSPWRRLQQHRKRLSLDGKNMSKDFGTEIGKELKEQKEQKEQKEGELTKEQKEQQLEETMSNMKANRLTVSPLSFCVLSLSFSLFVLHLPLSLLRSLTFFP
jgi:hypothetical protein